MRILIASWFVPFPYLKFLAIVIILTIIPSGCSRGIPEDEPRNNTRKEAQKLEPGQILKGTFYSRAGNDIDYVYITVDSPHLISGELTAQKGIDSEILFFNKGEALPFNKTNDNKSSLGEHFGPLLIKAPGVVIALRSRSPVNDESYKGIEYNFSYKISAAPENVEAESNDTFESANELTGPSIYGYYNNALNNDEIEKDVYFVNLPEKIKYRVSAKLSGVAGIDPVLKLYSEDHKELLSQDNGTAGEGENIFSFGAEGPAKLYFFVSAKDFKTSMDPYELSVTAAEYDEKYELEPNNDILHATAINTDQMIGDFSGSEDVDFFKVFNSSLETYSLFLELKSDRDTDIKFELYRSLNTAKSVPVIFDDGKEGESEGAANIPLKPLETIYIKVSRKNARGPIPYNLRVEKREREAGYEEEPNNIPKKANAIVQGIPVLGYINPGSDSDYYQIKLSGQTKVNVNLAGLPHCKAVISVLDSREIITDSVTSSEKQESLSLDTILEPNGYVMIKCETMEKPSYTEPYSLTVSEVK